MIDHPYESLTQRHRRRPSEKFLGTGDVRAPSSRIPHPLLRHHDRLDLTGGPGHLDDDLSEGSNGELVGVPDVDRTCRGVVEQRGQTRHLVRHVAETPGLRSVTVDRQGLASKCLDDEGVDDPPIGRCHPLAIGVEDPGDTDICSVDP